MILIKAHHDGLPIPKRSRKVTIDSRFQSMFTEDAFKVKCMLVLLYVWGLMLHQHLILTCRQSGQEGSRGQPDIK